MWTPLHAHVTDIHPQNMSAWNDCFPGSLARALYELGKVPLTADPWALINEISLVGRGVPDARGDLPMYGAECINALAHYGLPDEWTGLLAHAQAAPMAIYVVNGTLLQPAQYPASWFAGDPYGAHCILRLPNGVYNDPMAYWNGQKDCVYSEASIAQAFMGAYLLPAPPATRPQHKTTAKVTCALKITPSHTSHALTRVPKGSPLTVLPSPAVEVKNPLSGAPERWERVVAGHYIGWLLAVDLEQP